MLERVQSSDQDCKCAASTRPACIGRLITAASAAFSSSAATTAAAALVPRRLGLLRVILGLVSSCASDGCDCVMDGVEIQVTAHFLQNAALIEGLQHLVWRSKKRRVIRPEGFGINVH